ncbi:MAG TPA: TauD/TfdA family dioxygenase [Rhodocyclaceae bacterium]|nr:TauD/TfdA family dioxygenase [Rhodocyclaceae bacterium]
MSKPNASRLALERWNAQPRTAYRHISVRSLTPTIGAEITGLNIANRFTNEQEAEIRQALADHQVIVIRDQHLTPAAHKAFAARFGHLHRHKLVAEGQDPDILAWKTGRDSSYAAGEGWHSDVSCDENPIWGSILRVTKLPEIGGGDTVFSNMHLAYETLSPQIRALLRGLTAVHDGAHAWTRAFGIPPKPGQTYPVHEHPLVVTHPLTGRPVLYVNEGFTSHIPQLSRPESEALLALLFQHIQRGITFQARIQWQPDSLVFWDNWATQHHAVWDYFPFERWGERVSVLREGRLEAWQGD